MNKEYIDINGNIVLEDEKGKKNPIEYRENLKEILIQENVIEIMRIEKRELQEKLNYYNKTKKTRKGFILFPFIVFTFAPVIVFSIFDALGVTGSEAIINTFWGPIENGLFYKIAFTSLFSPLGGLMSIANYNDFKKEKKEEEARKSAIEYLNGALEKAKEDLEEMKKQKTEESKKKGFRIVKINDSQAIRELYEHIHLYYDCGYNGEKYYRYYQKHGQLPRKLMSRYNEDGQQAIIEYLEEKGPTLVKKRVS